MAQPLKVAIGFEYVVTPVKWVYMPGGVLVPFSRDRGRVRRADALMARDEFFHLKPGDNDQLMDFLNRWGPWHQFEFASDDPSIHGEIGVTPSEIWRVRETFLRGVMNPVDEWLADKSVVRSPLGLFQPRREYPHFFLRAKGIAVAIHTTITIDLLRKVKFRRCAREDCLIPFAVESKHRRKYCTQYCGHIESVRKKRREQQKLKRAIALERNLKGN